MTDLRAACIHGRYESHYPTFDDPDWASNDKRAPCPGGREVTDREIREAAYQVWLADQRALITEALVTETADFEGWEARRGALGVTDE